ncbi:MAG: GAF domain-containing protein [Armatimonadota bacterium]
MTEMTIAVLADVSREWARLLRETMGEGATVLEAEDPEATVELLQSVPADLIVMEMQKLVRARTVALQRVQEQAPQAVVVCIAPDEVIDRVRFEQLPAPDMWLRTEEGTEDREEVVRAALERARLRSEVGEAYDDSEPAPVVSEGEADRSSDLDAFRRLMGGVEGGFDLDRLLEAYVDAVTHFIGCASYCLLWERDEGHLAIRCQRGIRAEVVEAARLGPRDALPTWYRRNRRVLTVGELPSWPDRKLAGCIRREMDLFGAQVAVPLMVRGRLAGILMLGEKVLGERYRSNEIEVLFNVSSHVALSAEGIELHQELGRSKAYADRIVESMGAGLIMLGPDERIAVCNPYAARVLRLERGKVEGADLRALPSPLGDMLYAALADPDAGTTSEEVSIRGGRATLRVTTSPLHDDTGQVRGSILMLSDITAEKELARERSRRERLDVLTKIVGRIAHEVKNPLTAVKTYAELMSGRGVDDDRLARFWSQTVLPEIDQLDQMLKDMLRMVEQPEPKTESARLEELLSEAIAAIPMSEEIKQQSFNVQLAEDLPPVMVDPEPTRDALAYLMQYLAGSRPYVVQVQAEWDADDPTRVVVKMTRRSRGDGQFDPETIFDPLAAIQSPESELGPAISQRIIANQHGRVEASCEDGRVTMRVVLPRSQ